MVVRGEGKGRDGEKRAYRLLPPSPTTTHKTTIITIITSAAEAAFVAATTEQRWQGTWQPTWCDDDLQFDGISQANGFLEPRDPKS